MRVRPKFLADADLSENIVDGLLRLYPEVDLLDANNGGTRGLPDHEVLRIAAASGRVLISHDRNTMIRHFIEFTASHESPGLLIVKQQISIGETIGQIHDLWLAVDEREWRNQVRFGRVSDD